MNRAAPSLLLILIVTLAIAAGAAVLVADRTQTRPAARAAEFQRLVGGLGLGPATDLARCPFGFDPRLSPECQENLGPIPGGIHFCPHHAGSVFFYPRLDCSGEANRGAQDR